MKQKKIIALLILGLSLLSCGQSNSPKHVLIETYFREMIQLALDLPRLQAYYHVNEDTARRQIIFQRLNGLDFDKLKSVTKFGRPITVMTENEIKSNGIKSYFAINQFVSTKEFIKLQLSYPIEGLLIYYKFEIIERKLTIVDFSLSELKKNAR